jgi:hypothetical protein
MVFPLLMTMSIVALVVIAVKQWNTNEKVKKIEKILKYYIDGKENKNKETEGDSGDDSGGN